MIRFTTLCALAFLAACSPAETPAPESPPQESAIDTNALTATGWGSLQIGMTRAALVAAVGDDANPNAVGGAEPEQCDEFYPANAPQGMLVMVENGLLTRISLIRDATLRTEQGIGLGDAADAVLSAYSGASRTPHKYNDAPEAGYITVWQIGGGGDYVQDPTARGLVFEIDAEGRVSAIRAGGPSIQYVEGCA